MGSYFGFGKIFVAGQPSIISNGYSSQVNFAAGNNVTITTNPSTNTVTFNATSGSNASGVNNSVQYNSNGAFAGSGNFTYDASNSLLSLNGSVNFANTSNVSLGSISNIHISGGSSGYVLSTDGSGHLQWVAPSTPGAAGANQNVQFNYNGSLAGSNSFRYDIANSMLTVPYVTASVLSASGSATITQIFTNNLVSNGNVISNYFIGDGSKLTNITGANVTGQVNYAAVANSVAGANVSGYVANATHATVSNTANSVSVANVAGIGNVAVLNLNGNATTILYGNGVFAPITNVANSNYANYAGNAFSVAGSNVTGQVNYAAVANSVAGANVSGQVSYAAIANSVAGSNVTGQVNYAAVANRVAGSNVTGQVSNAIIAGTVYTNAQPNITSLGTLASLTVNGNSNLSSLNVNGLSNLGSVSNITIAGGANGYVLTTDGAGNLSWSMVQSNGGGNGNATAASPNLAVQFNYNGNFAGSSSFTYDNANAKLLVQNINASNLINASNITASNVSLRAVSNVGLTTDTYMLSNGIYVESYSGSNLISRTNIGSGSVSATGTITANNIVGNLITGNIITAQQPNITSLGTLTGLAVNGNTTTSSLTVSGNTNLGYIGNITISGGTAGYFLSTDGLGNLSWQAVNAGNGGSIPGGVNKSVQFNASGAFLGDNYFTYDSVTRKLSTPNISISNVADFSNATTVNLGNISNVSLSGGSNGYYLTTNGSGRLSWSAPTVSTTIQNGTSNVSIPNTNGNVDISVNGTSNVVVVTSTGANITGTLSLSGNATLGNIVTGAANVTTLKVSGVSNLGNIGNVQITGGSNGQYLTTNGTGGLNWTTPTLSNAAGPNTSVQYNNNNSFAGSNTFVFDAANSILSVPSIKSNTSANFAGAGIVNLGAVNNIKITGGTTGYVLQTDGTGNLSWTAQSGGGGGGGSGGLPSRLTTNITISNLGNGNVALANVTLANSFALYQIVSSVGAWVTVYSANLQRQLDLSRTVGTIPTAGSGVLAEIIETGGNAVTQLMTPPAICFSSEATPSSTIPIKVVNLSGTTSNVTLTFTYLPLEA